MDDTPHPRYSIGELAEAGGVSRRAVRFYVQRGLVAPPHGVGRGAHYDAAHLAQLLEIKRRQGEGAALEAIARGPDDDPSEVIGADGPGPAAQVSVPEHWSRLALAPGVELGVRHGALTEAQLAAVVQALRTTLATFTPFPRSPR